MLIINKEITKKIDETLNDIFVKDIFLNALHEKRAQLILSSDIKVWINPKTQEILLEYPENVQWLLDQIDFNIIERKKFLVNLLGMSN